jgi:hypothetical protein
MDESELRAKIRELMTSGAGTPALPKRTITWIAA